MSITYGHCVLCGKPAMAYCALPTIGSLCAACRSLQMRIEPHERKRRLSAWLNANGAPSYIDVTTGYLHARHNDCRKCWPHTPTFRTVRDWLSRQQTRHGETN